MKSKPKAKKRKAPKVSKSELARRLHRRSPTLTVADIAERTGLTWMGTKHALRASGSKRGLGALSAKKAA